MTPEIAPPPMRDKRSASSQHRLGLGDLPPIAGKGGHLQAISGPAHHEMERLAGDSRAQTAKGEAGEAIVAKLPGREQEQQGGGQDRKQRGWREQRGVGAWRAGEEGAVPAQIPPDYRLWGGPPANDAQRRRSRDPLSSLIAMAIDVGLNRRCTGAYPTFDGRFHYLLELSGGEVDQFEGGGYEGQVLKCRLSYVAVAGYECFDSGRRRIPHGAVWFPLAEDSRFAPPVRISTPSMPARPSRQ